MAVISERPLAIMNECGLWYSPDEGIYYWQDNFGAGSKVSTVSYITKGDAIEAMKKGWVVLK